MIICNRGISDSSSQNCLIRPSNESTGTTRIWPGSWLMICASEHKSAAPLTQTDAAASNWQRVIHCAEHSTDLLSLLITNLHFCKLGSASQQTKNYVLLFFITNMLEEHRPIKAGGILCGVMRLCLVQGGRPGEWAHLAHVVALLHCVVQAASNPAEDGDRSDWLCTPRFCHVFLSNIMAYNIRG